MDINDHIESPLHLKISFSVFLKQYGHLLNSESEFVANNARRVINIAAQNPILIDGFSDVSVLETYKKEIEALLEDVFNPVLSRNEIKTASVPFQNLTFNTSERFKSIQKNAGKNFELKVKNMPSDQKYIIACALILNSCYGYSINFKRPFFYEIPDLEGVMRYYKILYNADYIEITPTKDAPNITRQDYDALLDNFENIELWKQKFPPNTYHFKGFVISNMFDVTDDQSISNIKSSLLEDQHNTSEGFHDIFRSLFGLKGIETGFSTYNKEDDTFERVYGSGINSFLLNDFETAKCSDALCEWSYNRLLIEKKYFSVSDVNKAFETSETTIPHIAVLKAQGIKSAIFAPIANEKGLLGILEIVSKQPQVLNSISANKLVDVMPFIVSAVERSKNEEENLIEAVIQKECTSIHPSVHWRFEKEAKIFIKNQRNNKEASFNKISFENVYPLYGQIDIKGSSDARNLATQQDLALHLNTVKHIISEALILEKLPIYNQYIHQIDTYLIGVKNNFQVDSEHQISAFIKTEIDPVLSHLLTNDKLREQIKSYFNTLDGNAKGIYHNRKNYDTTVSSINKEMAALLDQKQIEAQAMYPHYFERFKTDGVEHNMYIGKSINEEKKFNSVYLYNLRLWQLQVMCEMENNFYLMQSKYPVKLDVASMILVFNQPLSISFRMDEKQFDVDGTYNARYEIVKKRVDKAFIKGTTERVTQKGKLSIVYSQKQDEREYLNYINFLQSKNYLDTDVEILDIEDLQAVTGLKAIRVSVLYNKVKNDKSFYTYNDLMKEISH